MRRKKIVIVGGGIGGISSAFFLDHTKYDIYLYEKHKQLGGYARNENTYQHYENEHSPRILTVGYKYFIHICHRIPEIKKNMIEANVKDIGFSVPSFDKLKLIYIFIKYFILGNKEESIYNDSVTLQKKIMDKYTFSKSTKKSIQNVLFKLGTDFSIPFSLCVSLAWTLLWHFNENYYCFNDSFEKAFITPVSKYLQSEKKVRIFKEHVLQKIHFQNRLPTSSKTIDYLIINGSIIKADYYILALDIRNLSNLFYIHEPKFPRLQKLSHGMQMGVLLVFNKYIPLDGLDENIHYSSLNSDWNPIIQMREHTWKTKIKNNDHTKRKSEWSICIPNMYTKSSYTKKAAAYSTKQEILKELIRQIQNYTSVPINIYATDIEYFEIWSAFIWDDKNRIWKTNEPYFVQAKGTNHLRPSLYYSENTYMAGAIVKGLSYPVWFKEAAAESGFKVAQILNGKK